MNEHWMATDDKMLMQIFMKIFQKVRKLKGGHTDTQSIAISQAYFISSGKESRPKEISGRDFSSCGELPQATVCLFHLSFLC
jgi:hypothetical protein